MTVFSKKEGIQWIEKSAVSSYLHSYSGFKIYQTIQSSMKSRNISRFGGFSYPSRPRPDSVFRPSTSSCSFTWSGVMMISADKDRSLQNSIFLSGWCCRRPPRPATAMPRRSSSRKTSGVAWLKMVWFFRGQSRQAPLLPGKLVTFRFKRST